MRIHQRARRHLQNVVFAIPTIDSILAVAAPALENILQIVAGANGQRSTAIWQRR